MADDTMHLERVLATKSTSYGQEQYILQAYSPTLLSQPERRGLRNDKPWVVQLDNFLSADKCATLIEQGALQSYERLKDVGRKQFDGTYGAVMSDSRTSTDAWCLGGCLANNTAQAVLQRIEQLMRIPDSHSEYLQLLKYEEGQSYEMQHDYIHHHTRRAQGPRILTIFLYLNDVDEGGGTRFSDLDITVITK